MQIMNNNMTSEYVNFVKREMWYVREFIKWLRPSFDLILIHIFNRMSTMVQLQYTTSYQP